MDHVPLRDHLEALLSQHQEHVDGQFSDLKHEVRRIRDHSHPGYVLWAALVPLLLTLSGLLVLWLG